ncbi:MAG: O-antigen ligase family protein [Pseudonocardia sp.]
MPEATPGALLPRQRQGPVNGARPLPAPARDWDGPGPGFVTSRYDTTGRGGSGVRVTSVVMVAIVLLAAAIVVVPGTVGPGLGIAAVGVGTALVLAGLNSPTIAIVLLIVTLFLRQGLRVEALPAEPYLFAFAGVLGAAGVALSRRRSQAPQFGAVEAMMAMFLLWCIGSAVLPHPYPASEGTPAHYFILLGIFVPFVLYIVGRAVIDNERTIRVVLWTLLGVWSYSVLHSILQFHAKPLAWPATFATYGADASWSNRALGVFGNPVENGFVLVLGFVLALYVARTPITRPMPRLALYAMSFLCLYAIYLTRTRAVYVVFALALVGAVLLVPRVRVICLALLGGGVVGALAFAPVLLTDDRNAGGLLSSYEIQDRLNMIATAFWAIGEKPIAGWGIARFSSVNTYHHQQWSQDIPWFRGYGIEAHFMELGIATELGLIGLALWVPLLVLVYRRLRRAVRVAPRGADLLVGRELVVMLAAFACLWVLVGFTVDLRFLSFGNAMAWLLAGVAVGTAERLPPAEPALPTAGGPSSDLAEDEELYLRWVAAER